MRKSSTVPQPLTAIKPSAESSPPAEEKKVKRKPKARTQYSCTECHRRKQKCDRQTPCNHCSARKVPCVPFKPGQDNDVNHRLTRVEGLVESLLPLLRERSPSINSSEGPSKRRRTGSNANPVSADEDDEERDELANVGIGPAATGTLHHNGNWYGPSSLNVSEIANDLVEKVGGQSTTEFDNTQSPIAVDDQLSIMIQEFGVSLNKLDTLVDELPQKSLSDKLVDSFFAHINWTRYPIHEQSFRVAYEATYNKRRSIEAKDIKYLPLVFIVLATTLRFAPNEEIAVEAGSGLSENERRRWALKLYWSSRRCSLIVSTVQGDCIEMVITRLLSTRLLINERRLTESWSQLGGAIRTAQSLGMHRDGSKLGLSPWETEYRRRIWSYLQHADNTLALILGRPPSIIPAYCDTLPPANLDDADFQNANEKEPIPKPINIPTVMTAHVLRHSFVQIVARCNEHFSNLRAPSSYSNVLRLDSEISEFLERLPSIFQFVNPDTSLDSEMPWLPTHRFLLAVECYFTKISLHRPWVLRKVHSSRYAPSRKACFESAKLDFYARERFKRETNKALGRFGGGQYRIFNSTLISAIALILEPFGPDAAQHKHILDSFLFERHDKAMKVSLPWDEAMVNETRIIQLFRNKAEELQSRNIKPNIQNVNILNDKDIAVKNEDENSDIDTTVDKDPSLRFAQPNANNNANLLMAMSNQPSNPSNPSNPSPNPVSNMSLQPPPAFDQNWQWATPNNSNSMDMNSTLNDAPADTIAMLLGLGVPDMMNHPTLGYTDQSLGVGVGNSSQLPSDESIDYWQKLISSLNEHN